MVLPQWLAFLSLFAILSQATLSVTTAKLSPRAFSTLSPRVQVDLVGGYYDAGDNVKFGLPMAFTITVLCWCVIEYGKEIAEAEEYAHGHEAIRWWSDYCENLLGGNVRDKKYG
ncbi:Glycoside hydrolase [Trema orientale]|uniref:cellulase n=1 Tax=Trema orientale TaxID=63057 RepID=A0A2P5F293_TREOI|nr:Glycoside hydrolase [Trema orientale]